MTQLPMSNILQDIVAHTHNLSFLPLVKITGTQTDTIIESMADDRAVILSATTKTPVTLFDGVFGLPNLEILALHLKNPEYQDNAKITVTTDTRNNVVVPVGLHFENAAGDFKNDYRFMNAEIINEKLKTVKFRGAKWDVEFTPSQTAIQRLRLQSQAHSDEKSFQVTVSNGDLKTSFGDSSSHAGNFVFQAGVNGALKHTLSWPVSEVLAILGLGGDKIIRISDAGAMQIVVDSGLAEYTYILPAQSK